MANLGELKKLVEQAETLESDVSDLERRKTGLEQDCITLSAKTVYLKDEIAKHTQSLEDEIERVKTAKLVLDGEIEALEAEKTKLQSENRDLADEATGAKATLEEIKQDQDEEAKQFIKSKQIHSDELSVLEAQVGNKEKQIAILNTKWSSLKSDINDAVDKKAGVEKETAQVKFDAEKAIEAGKAELKRIDDLRQVAIGEQTVETGKLKAIRVELKAAEEKIAAFKEYEERSRKTLRAREEHILEKEEQIKESLKVMTRRSRILRET